MSKKLSDICRGNTSEVEIMSWIDVMLFTQLGANDDSFQNNQYYFRIGPNSPIFAGPMWDTDLGFQNVGWVTKYQTENLWAAVFSKLNVLETFEKRWFSLRKKVLTTENMLEIIDKEVEELSAYITKSEWRNQVAEMKKFLDKQAVFIDENINSFNRKLNETNNKN